MFILQHFSRLEGFMQALRRRYVVLHLAEQKPLALLQVLGDLAAEKATAKVIVDTTCFQAVIETIPTEGSRGLLIF